MERHQPHRAGAPALPAGPPEVRLLAQDQGVPQAAEALVEHRGVPQVLQSRGGAVPGLPLLHQLPGLFCPEPGEPFLRPVQPGFKDALPLNRLPQGRELLSGRCFPEGLGPLDQIRRTVPQQPEGGLQRRAVRRRQQGPEECHRTPDRRIVPEVLPPGDQAGDVIVAEAHLHQLQLAVGAAEHRDVGEGPDGPLVIHGLGLQHIHAAGHAADLLGDEHRLGKAVRRLHQPHCRPCGPVGDQEPLPAGVVGDRRQCRLQYSGGGAVIICQADFLYSRDILPQTLETPGISAPEPVDGLVRVADDEQVPAPAPGADQLVLDVVEVL